MYVLGGPPSTSDPHDASSWEFLGPIRNLDTRQWAIDGTVFELDNDLYFAYSGWPLEQAPDDYDERTQQLFIARMSDPTTLSSAPVMISHPDREWERSGEAGINEGPQFLSSPDGTSWRGLVYSCAGSWTKDYKMATLQFLGGDPLRPEAWKKSDEPLLQNSDDRHGSKGPFGPGHGNFVRVGDETMAVFHATDGPGDGHSGRKCRLQRVEFGVDGRPFMGGCVGEVTRDLGVFSQGSGSAGRKEGKGAKLKGVLESIARKI